MSRILLFTGGSLGDVLPMVYVGAALRMRGHEVRVIANDAMQEQVVSRGLEFRSDRAVDPQLVFRDGVTRAPGTNPFRIGKYLWRVSRGRGLPSFESIMQHKDSFQWSDVIVGSHGSMAAVHLAEKYKRPWIAFHTTPNLPSRSYATYVGPLWWHLLHKPAIVNRVTHEVWQRIQWRPFKTWSNEFRKHVLKLDPLKESAAVFQARFPRIIAASRAAFPAPTDWPANWHLTGYPLENPSSGMDLGADVRAFLDSGKPPVCIGFSSTPILDQRFWTDVVQRAIEILGCRAILVSSWSTIPGSLASPSVMIAKSLPFRSLFPRVACVVHACGIGTLSEAIISGTPSVCVPAFGEQKFIAARAYRQGLIARPCELKHLTASRLSQMIRAATETPDQRVRTGVMAQAMNGEQGLERACDLIESYLPSNPTIRPSE